jgi:hypothetical protein
MAAREVCPACSRQTACEQRTQETDPITCGLELVDGLTAARATEVCPATRRDDTTALGPLALYRVFETNGVACERRTLEIDAITAALKSLAIALGGRRFLTNRGWSAAGERPRLVRRRGTTREAHGAPTLLPPTGLFG